MKKLFEASISNKGLMLQVWETADGQMTVSTTRNDQAESNYSDIELCYLAGAITQYCYSRYAQSNKSTWLMRLAVRLFKPRTHYGVK